MTKPWHPRAIPGRRPSKRSGWPKEWNRYRARPRRRRRSFGWGAIRTMMLAGTALGLALAFRPGAVPGGAAEAGVAAAVRVIDGDTFDHGGVTIRIADIDTPEMAGGCAYERALARRATMRLDALLGEGPFELRGAPDGRDEDSHGRKLRIATRGGESLGGVLVAEGLARHWTGRREPWC